MKVLKDDLAILLFGNFGKIGRYTYLKTAQYLQKHASLRTLPNRDFAQ